jgi:hypothetical protein
VDGDDQSPGRDDERRLVKGLGLALSIVGALVTIWGLVSSKNELFPNDRPVLHRWRALRPRLRRAWRFVLRRPAPPPQIVHAQVATALLSATGHAFGHVTAGPGATTEHRIELVERNIEQLRERDSEIESRVGKVAGRVDAVETELRNEIARLHEAIPQSVGGRNGQGFTIAWIGVLIGLVGTVLSSI